MLLVKDGFCKTCIFVSRKVQLQSYSIKTALLLMKNAPYLLQWME